MEHRAHESGSSLVQVIPLRGWGSVGFGIVRERPSEASVSRRSEPKPEKRCNDAKTNAMELPVSTGHDTTTRSYVE